MRIKHLTPARRKWLNAIAEWCTEHNSPPSLRDLLAVLGYTSTNAAYEKVKWLRKHGYLFSAKPGAEATLMLTDHGWNEADVPRCALLSTGQLLKSSRAG
jgi:SOS-response transcriptional repressor LexA